MENTVLQIIVVLLTAFGGGFFGAYFQSRFQHKKEVEEDIHQLKRKRYGSILIQMLTILDPERGLAKVQQFREDLKNVEDFKEEVKTEMLHSILFANDEVIRAMAEFVKNLNHASYIKTVSAMRKDLWGKDTAIGEDILKEFAAKSTP
ncbi:MAG: hypothetical protein WC421_11330 [Elusimicrobiales bacterium]